MGRTPHRSEILLRLLAPLDHVRKTQNKRRETARVRPLLAQFPKSFVRTSYDLLILGQVSMSLWLRMKSLPDCHLLSRSFPQRSNLVHITSTWMSCPLRYGTSPIK